MALSKAADVLLNIQGYKLSTERPCHKLITEQLNEKRIENWGVEIGQVQLTSLAAKQCSNMVRPCIRVHALNIHTGCYVYSHKRSALCIPKTFSIYPMKDNHTVPNWGSESIVLDAEYSEIVHPNVVLLFELLDEKPTLKSLNKQQNMNNTYPSSNSRTNAHTKNKHVRELYKKIAWGFLLPISSSNMENGNDMLIHVGICGDWRKEADVSNSVAGSPNNDENNTSILSANTNTNSNTIQFKKVCIQLHTYQPSNIVCRMQEAFQLLFKNAQNSKLDGNTSVSNTSLEANKQKKRKNSALMLTQKQMSLKNLNFHDDEMKAQQENGETFIPDVYFQYRRLHYVKLMPSNVNISLCIGPKKLRKINVYRPRSHSDSVPHSLSDNECESDRDDQESNGSGEYEEDEHQIQIIDSVQDNDGGGGNARLKHISNNTKLSSAEIAHANKMKKMRAAVLKRTRAINEPCVIPTKLLTRIDPNNGKGASIIRFSHCGHLLVVCCPTPNAQHVVGGASNGNMIGPDQSCVYSLKFYDIDQCNPTELSGISTECVHTIHTAHHAIIYDVEWSENDAQLLTVGGDGQGKLWDLKFLSNGRNKHLKQTKQMALLACNNPNNGTISDSATKGTPACLSSYPISHVMSHVPPVYIYSCVFWKESDNEFVSKHKLMSNAHTSSSTNMSTNNRIITGAADGKLRVWEHGELLGYISINSASVNPSKSRTDGTDADWNGDGMAHHSAITALTIEESTKYLISGDSDGIVLIWKIEYFTNPSGEQKHKSWYRILRKLRTELSNPPIQMISHLTTTHNMHANQKASLLVTAPPSGLSLFSLHTYKPSTSYPGLNLNINDEISLVRGIISSDNKYVCCGGINTSVHSVDNYSMNHTSNPNSSNSNFGNVEYILKFWDATTGQQIQYTPLADYKFPFGIRDMAWHPTQHVLVTCSLGTNASILVFYSEKETTTNVAKRLSTLSVNEMYASLQNNNLDKNSDTQSEAPSVSATIEKSDNLDKTEKSVLFKKPLVLSNSLHTIQERVSSNYDSVSNSVDSTSSSINRASRSDRVNDILQRLRAQRQNKMK